MGLPDTFCWSKFGAEAGEPPDQIRARKESERLLNGGTFLWGIGNSIRPSLAALLRICRNPEVIFTPMLASAVAADASPSSVVIWREAIGMDGARYELPRHSAVTSRPPGRRRGSSHYALVCNCNFELSSSARNLWLDHSAVRNLLTGSPVGSSQVTSIVKRINDGEPCGRRYEVAFRAFLIHPYLITLSSPCVLPNELRLDRRQGDSERIATVEEILTFRRTSSVSKMDIPLF